MCFYALVGVLYAVYSYRWVSKWQHISLTILASNNCPPLIPYKDLASKVLADISSRALSAKVSKLGCHFVSLPEEHAQVLQQHDASFRKSSRFMYLVDFVRVCKLYEVKIPESLEDLYSLHSLHTLADIQSGKVASLTSETYQNQQAARVEQSMVVALDQGANNMPSPNFSSATFIPSYQPAVFHSQGQFYTPQACSYANNFPQLMVTTASLPVAGHEVSPLVGAVPNSVQPPNVPQMPQASFDGRISRSHSSPMKPSSLAALQNSGT